MTPSYNIYAAFNALHQLGDTPQARELRNVLLRMQQDIDRLTAQLAQLKGATRETCG
jgi:hypothetical protein